MNFPVILLASILLTKDVNAFAFLRSGLMIWKEEVFLHDGSMVIIAALNKRLTIVCMFLLAFIPQEVWAKQFTCTELASFTAGIAKFRDQGVPLITSKKAVADGKFTDVDKQTITKLVDAIYESPNISLAEWYALAEKNCKSARRK